MPALPPIQAPVPALPPIQAPTPTLPPTQVPVPTLMIWGKRAHQGKRVKKGNHGGGCPYGIFVAGRGASV